jgi:hypothetical protein
MRPFLLLALVTVSASACGGRYGRRVPDDVLQKLPYESKIELLEAENDLAIAFDRVDESESEMDRTRAAIRRAKDRLGAAEQEVGRAPDDGSRDIARLAVTEGEARLEYLRARQDVNAEKTDIQGLALECAKARFELERVRIAKKAKVPGAEGLGEADFEGQVGSCEQDVAKRRDELKEHSQRMSAAKERWDLTRSQLVKKTFDARASPYVE